MSINDWRNEIDAIDRELLRLLNMRACMAIKVGALKKEAGLSLNDLEREQDVLEKVSQANTGPLVDQNIRSLFRRIIRESRRTQQRTLEAKAPGVLQEAIR